MKPKTMILMGLAVACGLGASFMTSRLLAERKDSEETKEYVKVLVAKKNLDMGTIINKNGADLFEEKSFVKGEEPKLAIQVAENQLASVIDQLKGRQLKISRRPGDVVSMEDLYDRENSGMQGALPEGHRAIGIRVSLESIAGGFASLPHSKVDIISTVRRGNDRDSYARILLENVLVLAADTVTKRNENSDAQPASVVTVALTPEQVLKVNIAKEIGALSLALRRFGDTKPAQVDKVTIEQVNNNSTREPAKNDDSGDDDGKSPGIGALTIPQVGTTGTKKNPVVAAAPKVETTTYRLRVIEGDKERHTDYVLDKNGDVINHEVNRSDLDAPVTPQTRQGPPAGPREGPPVPTDSQRKGIR